jgi:hypothetical protein
MAEKRVSIHICIKYKMDRVEKFEYENVFDISSIVLLQSPNTHTNKRMPESCHTSTLELYTVHNILGPPNTETYQGKNKIIN